MNFTERDCVYLQLALKNAINNVKDSLSTKSIEERARLLLIMDKWEFLRDLTIRCAGRVDY